MVSSNATSVDEYLSEIEPDRRADIEQIRDMIPDNLPDGYAETMRWGMITYEVPRPDARPAEGLG